MKPLRVVYTAEAMGIIRQLPPMIKRGVRSGIDEIADNPLIGKPLRNELEGLRSMRFKQYRIIYRIADKRQKVMIVHIGSRRDVYRILTHMVRQERS